MRHLGTLPDSQTAQKLSAFLLSESIETRVLQEGTVWAIWVCDEDKLPRAREEFVRFQDNPQDERYRKAPTPRQPVEVLPPPRVIRHDPLTESWRASRRRVTLILAVASVLVTILYLSPDNKPTILRELFLTKLEISGDYVYWNPKLPELQRFELWRLFTPALIHFDAMHLLGNMLALWILGLQVEYRWGSPRMALLVFVLGAASNLAQYFFSQVGLDGWRPIVLQSHPNFGGMSGVVFGLFGLVWIKAVYDPGCGLFVSPMFVVMGMMWFFLCMTGLVGPVANTAHLVGLAQGMILGYLSAWWNGFGANSPDLPLLPEDFDES